MVADLTLKLTVKVIFLKKRLVRNFRQRYRQKQPLNFSILTAEMTNLLTELNKVIENVVSG